MMGKKEDDFKRVMKGVREGNPEHIKREKALRAKQAKIDKAARDNAARRKQKPRTGNGHDVIDTGMFG